MNTLKFGNGEWYGKKDTILAYNDENSNYKPLPFDFSRASSATVVNADGLIETVGSGQPRIDYKDDSEGALLLEPSRTNLITYSEDFTKLTKTNTIITSNQAISPNGTQNADELTGSGFARAIYAIGNGDITVSCYVKSNNGSDKDFTMGAGSLGSIGNETFTATSEWQRFTHTFSATAQSTDFGFFAAGGVDLGLYLYGFQVEQGSYPTSYIPTQGSAVTRLAESCSQTAPDSVIGQTEGTLYAEIKANETSNASGRRTISLSDGTNSNRVYISFDDEYNKLNIFIVVGGTTVTVSNVDISNQNTYNKVAVRYNSGNSAIYVNGVLKNSFNDTFSSGVFNTLKFQNRGSGEFFNGNCKDLRVYNEALTDVELKALTTI
jgi:hypothetical protein